MSRMIRCSDGHFYDADKYSNCPVCGVKGLDIGRTRGRRAVEPPPPPSSSLPSPPSPPSQVQPPPIPTTPVERPSVVREQPLPKPPEDSGKTLGFWGKAFDPVVGWLVCIRGPEKGKDFRIKSERNFIGRSPEMDICIAHDKRISRRNHALISYNPRANSFKLVPGEGRALVYLNDAEVEEPASLNAYDIIEMADSAFIFVPLCGERFQWEKES